MFLLQGHYAGRMPLLKYSFGLFKNEELIGVINYSPAPSRFWNGGGHLFNCKHKIETLELSRLFLLDGHAKNDTSYFVANSIKMLPKPCVVVSYADANQNHCGYIYQACNFIYTGLAEPKNKTFDFLIYGRKYHGRGMNEQSVRRILGIRYNGEMHWKENIANVGGSILPQLPKHRYIIINAAKKLRAKLIKDMIYQQLPYPKTNNTNYNTGKTIQYQKQLF